MKKLLLLIISILMLCACGSNSNSNKESWEYIGPVRPTTFITNYRNQQRIEQYSAFTFTLWAKVIDGTTFYQLRHGDTVYAVTKNPNYNEKGAEGENFMYAITIDVSGTKYYINL